jgi:adenosylmethionine-8-amino-7-oxononanoate aminotransferase
MDNLFKKVALLHGHSYSAHPIGIFSLLHTCIQTYIHTYIHTHAHTQIDRYIHTYMHACMYTHTRTHTGCSVAIASLDLFKDPAMNQNFDVKNGRLRFVGGRVGGCKLYIHMYIYCIIHIHTYI